MVGRGMVDVMLMVFFFFFFCKFGADAGGWIINMA